MEVDAETPSGEGGHLVSTGRRRDGGATKCPRRWKFRLAAPTTGEAKALSAVLLSEAPSISSLGQIRFSTGVVMKVVTRAMISIIENSEGEIILISRPMLRITTFRR